MILLADQFVLVIKEFWDASFYFTEMNSLFIDLFTSNEVVSEKVYIPFIKHCITHLLDFASRRDGMAEEAVKRLCRFWKANGVSIEFVPELTQFLIYGSLRDGKLLSNEYCTSLYIGRVLGDEVDLNQLFETTAS